MDLPLADIAPTPIAPAAAPYDTAPYLRDELVHEMFAATAAAHPDRTALKLAIPDPESTRRSALTYAELRGRAAQFRRRTLLPLDDCLNGLQPRSRIAHGRRCTAALERHGISRMDPHLMAWVCAGQQILDEEITSM